MIIQQLELLKEVCELFRRLNYNYNGVIVVKSKLSLIVEKYEHACAWSYYFVV